MNHRNCIALDGQEVRVTGRLLRGARLKDEYYVDLLDPHDLVARVRRLRAGIDLFSFVQPLHDPEPRHAHAMTWDEMAVLRVSTFDQWFDRQIRFKPRNRLRKAWKSGVQTRSMAFDDAAVRRIMKIYDETPLRQGKRNLHYGKSFGAVQREHATFLDRSEFIGAYLDDEMIGFAKLTHGTHASIIMNIVAAVAHRDKAPMNALIAESVRCVASRGLPLLNYGVWGRRGLNDFKVVNAFERQRVPRYHVATSSLGVLALKLGLHRGLKERLPEDWIVGLADARASFNEWRYRGMSANASSVVGSPADPLG